jgi:nucleotide-binding universal stress UspA family protein
MLKLQSILHPTDLLPESAGAFEAAVTLAKLGGGTVHVLHVVAPPALVTTDGKLTDPTDPSVGQAWEEFKAKAATAGAPVNFVALVSDQAGAVGEILGKVDEGHCDLIVMATHGRTGLRRLVWGSVAEQTVRLAKPPVLVVKAG